MEFRLDAGQVELQQTVARFCADRFPLDARRRARGRAPPTGPSGSEHGRPRRCSGCCCPRTSGGSGLGVVEGALAVRAARLATWCPGPCCGPCSPRRWSTAPPTGERAGRRDRGRRGRRRAGASSSTPPTSTCCWSSTTTASSPTTPPTSRRRRRSTRSIRSRRSAGSPALAGGAPGRRRRRRRRSCGCSAPCSARPLLVGRGRPGARGRPRLRPRAPPVRRADRVVPGGQAPARRHVRAQRPGPERHLRRGGGRRRARRRRPGPGGRRRPSCSPPRRRSPTPAPPSRCSAAWASPGTCCRTTCSSGRGCSSRRSAPPTTTPLATSGAPLSDGAA